MRMRKEITTLKKRKLILAALAFCAAVTMFASAGCDKKDPPPHDSTEDTEQQTPVTPEEKDFPELQILSTTEDNSWVTVETTYGTFRYPFAFSDLITVKADSNDASASLQFTADVDGEMTVIYTIYYNEENGHPCGTLKLAEDEDPVTVSVVFAELPADMPEASKPTFFATQETFNDVLTSMKEDSRFSENQ